MKRFLTTLTLSLFTIAAITAADSDGTAKSSPKHHGKALEKFDANKDGKLDEQERTAARAALAERMKTKHPKLFAKADSDHDGVLSADEVKALRKAKREHRHDRKADEKKEKRDK